MDLKKIKISKDLTVKLAIWVLVPIVLSLIVFFIYREYLFNNNYINKVILSKDMEFKYFTYDEFDSRAGSEDIANGVDTYRRSGSQYITNSGRENMDGDVIKMFDDARHIVEIEWNEKNPNNKIYFVVNSGYRSDSRNKEVGGVEKSAHRNKGGQKSKAGDISWKNYNTEQRAVIEEALRRVGFDRIGKYNTFIHADFDRSLPYPANW
jgi:hypothetical protein